MDATIHFYVDGKKQKTDHISLMGKQELEVAFFPTFESKGNHYVTAEVSADSLATDNKRHLSFEVLEQIKVLLIDGEPKPGMFESECDYLMAAIGSSPQNLIKATKITIGELTPEVSFKNFDVLIIANLETLEEKRFTELENFVEKGGGAFLWLGDRVPFEHYNQELFKPGREFLPGEIKGSPIGDASKKEHIVFSLQDISPHRVWRYFHLNRRLMEDLKKCFIYRFFPVKIDPEDSKVKVLACYNDHKRHPALVERRFGRGKVIVSTTTADSEWNNFHTDQYGHTFVIMVHEFIQYLVSRPLEENNVSVGLPLIKRFDFFVQDARISPPEGEPGRPEIKSLEKGAAYRIQYPNTMKAGIYSLDLTIPSQIKEEGMHIATKEYFSVNPDPEEGDVTYLSKEELLRYLKVVELRYEQDLEKLRKTKEDKKDDIEYWQRLLVILLIMAGIESFLAMWFGRYT
jgi:hypothetical protein